MISLIFLLISSLCIFNVKSEYPLKRSPKIIYMPLTILVKGYDDSTTTIAFNGTFMKGVTQVSINDIQVNMSDVNINVTTCRLTANRNKGCERIKAVWGNAVLGSCEVPDNNGLICTNVAYLVTSEGYDLTPECDVIDPSNACRLIKCETKRSTNLPPNGCLQYGIGGTTYNIPNLGLECDVNKACDHQSQCNDAHGDECNSTVIMKIPSGLDSGKYNISLTNANGTTIIQDMFDIIKRPEIASVSTVSNSITDINFTLNEDHVIFASPGATVHVEYAEGHEPDFGIGVVLESFFIVPLNIPNYRQYEFEGNNTILPDPFDSVPNSISEMTARLYALYSHRGVRLTVPSRFIFTIYRVPVLFSLCPGIALAFTETTVVIQGANFRNQTMCIFEEEVVESIYISSSVLHCIVQPLNGTRRDVEISVSVDGGNVFNDHESPLYVNVLGSCDIIKPNSIPLNSECVCTEGDYDAGYACVPCDIGTYQPLPGQQSCIPCDDTKTTIDNRRTSEDECICKSGLYLENTEDVSCKLCPLGFTCADEGLVVNEGFWRQSNNSAHAIMCRGSGCAGGVGAADALCKDGYRGVVCSVCADGYGIFGTDCVKCQGGEYDDLILALMLIAGIIALYILIRVTTNGTDPAKHASPQQLTENDIHGSMATVIKITVNYLQILYYIGKISARWGKESLTLFSVFIPLSISPSFVSVQCASGSGFGFYDEMTMVMVLPIIVAAGLICVYMLYVVYVIASGKKYIVVNMASYTKNLLIILYIFLPMTAHELLRGMKCIKIDGVEGSYLEDDMSVRCDSQSYQTFMAIAVVYFLFYVIGLPAYVGYRMMMVKNKLIELLENGWVSDFASPYLYFVRGYANRAFLWEGVVLFMKISVVGTSLISSVVLQLLWCGVALSAVFMLTRKVKPYRTLMDNRISTISLIALMISTILGMHSFVIGGKGSVIIFVFLLIVNLGTLMTMGFSSWRRMKRLIDEFNETLVRWMKKMGFGDDDAADVVMQSATTIRQNKRISVVNMGAGSGKLTDEWGIEMNQVQN